MSRDCARRRYAVGGLRACGHAYSGASAGASDIGTATDDRGGPANDRGSPADDRRGPASCLCH